MLTAEVFNWTGHVLVTPRTSLAHALKRSESSFTGVYLLLGEGEDGEPMVYIGEGENIANRIKSHDANKDWWDQAVLITSAANNLHKAHVQYLEARLVEQAANVATTKLENNTKPTLPSLSEGARANMESFLDYLFMVLPAVRIDTFLSKTRPSVPTQSSDSHNESSTIFELIMKKENI